MKTEKFIEKKKKLDNKMMDDLNQLFGKYNFNTYWNGLVDSGVINDKKKSMWDE
jgi:hypothetical protein